MPRLLDDGADVVALVRDWLPEAELVSSLAGEVKIVRGDIRDQPLLERARYEIDGVFHLVAQTIVQVANRKLVGTWETNVAGTWALEACRRSPTVREIVIASSDKAYGDAGDSPSNAGRSPAAAELASTS